MRSRRIAAVFCLLALRASAASATPISYFESVSGDLNGAPTLALDSGLNTISGSFAVGSSQAPELPDDIGDEFTFSIPVGRTLTGVTFEFQVSSGLVTEWLDTVALAEAPGYSAVSVYRANRSNGHEPDKPVWHGEPRQRRIRYAFP